MAWRLNRETVLGLVVLRALLMQVAHPAVAQGVAEHSDFRKRPLARALLPCARSKRSFSGPASKPCKRSRGFMRAIHR